MIGFVVLLAAVVVTAAIAIAMQWKNGRFAAPATVDHRERLDAGLLGEPLGERATMVQFSSAFCSPCRATRVLLSDVAAKVPGVIAIDIDAEEHLELVRELDIMRTPTVLILDASGVVTTRASGLPRREQVLAALDRAIAPIQ